MRKSFILCVLIAVLCCSAAAVYAGPIRVAINPDTKPFKYLDEDGVFQGIDADVINGIAEAAELEIEFVEMDFSQIIEAVAKCEVDAAISALTQTERRSALVRFSDPYVMGLQSAFVRLSNDGWADISDPAIHVIGAKSGTTAEDNSRILSERHNFEVKLYANYSELFAALESDEIDAAISDELLAKEFVDSYADIMTIGQPLTSEPYAIAVCPTNSELLKSINSGLNTMRRSGDLDGIVLRQLSEK